MATSRAQRATAAAIAVAATATAVVPAGANEQSKGDGGPAPDPVRVPDSTADPIVAPLHGGHQVEIDLPGAVRAASRQDALGTHPAKGRVPAQAGHQATVFDNPTNDSDLIVQPSDTDLRILIRADGPQAPDQYRFDFDLPDGYWLEFDGDTGGAAVLTDGGYEGMAFIVATIAAPWAVDATNEPVHTYFTVEDSSLVQHLDHRGAAYPVIADPQYTWGIITGTAYFNRQETKDMRSQAGVIAAAAGICAFYGVGTAGAACALAAGAAILWQVQASNAWSDNRCLKIKIPTMEPGTYPWGERVCTDCPK